MHIHRALVAKSVVHDFRTGDRWFDPQIANFFPKIDRSQCDKTHSSLTAEHCTDDDYVD